MAWGEPVKRMRWMRKLKQEWFDAIHMLNAQRDNAPPVTVQATREIVRRIYDKAVSVNVPLQKPLWPDPVFKSMVLSSTTGMAEIMNEEEYAAYQSARNVAKTKRYKNKIRALNGQPPIPPRTTHMPKPKPKVPKRKCWCRMCSKYVAAEVRFAPGHGARIIAQLRRIEQGHGKRELMAGVWVETLVWRRCPRCMGWCPTTDISGRTMKGLGYACLSSMTKEQLADWDAKHWRDCVDV